ncbi:MAG TPA: acyl-CoA dehydrogenase family protein [Steroidobacteraceae bacterium]|nr:acyl-CoA dehydrogenase family protein [Steroidobacteraceae bacterium]
MDFQLTAEQVQLRASVRRFAQAELPALAKEIEETHEPLPRAMMKRYAELGYLGVNLPEAYGGHGMGHLDAVIVLEELAKVSPAVAFPTFESCFGPILAIAHFAPEELKRRVIPRVAAGEAIVAVSMSEPEAGSALTDLRTRATLEGDTVRLSGQKRWCSGAGHADGYLVYCRMSDEPGAAGIGAVYVEKDAPGFSFGKKERLMGFRGVPSADMFLDDVRVPAANIVVRSGGGFRKLMEAFDLERCGNATMSLAIAQGAFDYALGYVQERKQFGKPLVDFQAVQLRIAEMAMKLEAARLLVYQAVANASAGLPSVKESSIAKCFANEMVREVAGSALQVMGAYGYSKEFPMEQRLRDAWGWGIAGGAIDIQKVNIAAALVGRRFDQRR